jgi:hypothetical protein
MRAFVTILMIIGLMVASTPHLLCPMACAKAEHYHQAPKCSHCDGGHSRPEQAPDKECDSGCCDQIDAVPADIQSMVTIERTQPLCIAIDVAALDQSATIASANETFRLSFLGSSAPPVCALPILFEHLLL